jgi:hypothetical protein
LRYLGILKTFVFHHMAPMAGGITDAEKDGPIKPSSPLQGFGAPGVPIDRVMGVLLEIRAALVDEMIGGGKLLTHGIPLFEER